MPPPPKQLGQLPAHIIAEFKATQCTELIRLDTDMTQVHPPNFELQLTPSGHRVVITIH